jgi:hypothetical protein
LETGVILVLIVLAAVAAFLSSIVAAVRADRRRMRGDTDWEDIVAEAGYIYDRTQNIFYTALGAWQRNFGYTRLYDEAAAPMSLIIDCEPIYFRYKGKNWLIELWKGQYGMCTGCEVGVYNSESEKLYYYDGFNYTLYNCASDEDHLEMSLALIKNGRTLFTRKDRHWWLTGFVLGEFSEPSELVMDVTIKMKDPEMLRAFISSLREMGYTDNNLRVSGNYVGIWFSSPLSEQPYTRTELVSRLSQLKNKHLCERYRELTAGSRDMDEAIALVRQKAPELFADITEGIGRPARLFKDTKVVSG